MAKSGYLGYCSVLQRRCGPLGLPLLFFWREPWRMNHRCLEMQKILLSQPRHYEETPDIHTGHVQKVKQYSGVPSFVLVSVGIQYIATHWSMRSTPPMCWLYSFTENDLWILSMFFSYLQHPCPSKIWWGRSSAGRSHVDRWTVWTCDSDVSSTADSRTSPSSLIFELLLALQLQLCSLELVNSACASIINASLLQCLNEWNGTKEIVKKHLVTPRLYVITEGHDYIYSHSLSIDLTPPSWILVHCSHPFFHSPGFLRMYCLRDRWPLKGIIC